MMKKSILFIFMPGLTLLLIGYFIQSHLLLSGDVGYLMHASEQLLRGGQYATDFFETNPPMILYLYAPCYLLKYYLAVSDATAFRIYIFLGSCLSAGFCYVLLKQILKNESAAFTYFLFYTLLIIFFILPSLAFGQREHLLIILIMPYLLASVLIFKKEKLSYSLRFLIGCMAGVGFALKPFFLVTFGLVELYGFIKNMTIIRLECLVILLIFIVYGLSIYLWQPDYLTIILPLVARYYLPFSKQSIIIFFAPPYVLFCMSMIFSYLFFYKKDRVPELSIIILLALMGLLIAAILARTSWYYHVLPALSMAYLLAAVYLGQIKDKEMKILLSFFIFVVPFYSYYAQIKYGLHTKKNHAMNQVAQFINQSGEHAVYCIPLGTFDCFPFLEAMHGQYVERFPSFWWYTGLRQQEKKISLALKANQDKNYLIKQVTIDLQRAQWVIFNNAIFNADEMIMYLSQNTAFRTEWAYYHYTTHFGDYRLYKRINIGNENDKSSIN